MVCSLVGLVVGNREELTKIKSAAPEREEIVWGV